MTPASSQLALQAAPAYALEESDPVTRVIYLELPSPGVVLLQAHFELYEGMGIVRTLEAETPSGETRESAPRNIQGAAVARSADEGEISLLAIITTADQLEACWQALGELKPLVNWRWPAEQKANRLKGAALSAIKQSASSGEPVS